MLFVLIEAPEEARNEALAHPDNAFDKLDGKCTIVSTSHSATTERRAEETLVDGYSPVRSEVNSGLNFPSNFEGLVLGCIDADFCK